MKNVKEVLTQLDGCQGCSKQCKFNGCVAPKTKNKTVVNDLYNCNTEKSK